MNERRADLTTSIDKVLSTATPDCDGQHIRVRPDDPDGWAICIECETPVYWVDGRAQCPNGNCPMGDGMRRLIRLEDECDWPACTSVVLHVSTKRKTQRCDAHKSAPAWPDGTPRIELPGQCRLPL